MKNTNITTVPARLVTFVWPDGGVFKVHIIRDPEGDTWRAAVYEIVSEDDGDAESGPHLTSWANYYGDFAVGTGDLQDHEILSRISQEMGILVAETLAFEIENGADD